MGLEKFFVEKLDIMKLAKEVGYSPQYLRGVISGKLRPGRKLAEALERISEGEIKAAELIIPRKDHRTEKKNKRAVSIVKELIEKGEIKKTDLFPKKPVDSVVPTVESD